MKRKPFGGRVRPTRLGKVLVVTVVLGVVVAAGSGLRQANAEQTRRVALVVDFGDHHITRCVEFSESEITGYDVLRRAGLSLVVDASNPMGVIICDINNTSGCPSSNCFCRCQGSPCTYWAYHYLQGGSWQYSLLGASSRKVHDGDVEGWGWGEGALNNSGAKPPVIPFDQICTQPATETPVSTDTPIPPTDTPAPTATAVPPTNTPLPSDTPGPTTAPAPEAWFRLDQNPIAAGSCTVLRWDTSHARKAYLDGAEVNIVGTRQVCPAAATDYELRVVGFEAEETFRLTLGVTGSSPITPTPQPAVGPSLPPSTATPEKATHSPGSPTEEGMEATLTPPILHPESSATTSSGIAGIEPTADAPTVAPSVARPQIAQAQPTATAAQVGAQTQEQSSGPESEISSSLLIPIGYAGFSLIVGGLLGWLIYALRFRGRRE